MPDPASARSFSGRRALLRPEALLFPVLVALVFGRVLPFEFLDLDDLPFIHDNPQVPHPLSLGVRALLLTPHLGYPQTLVVLAQHLCYRVGEGAPWPFHLLNLLLHGANVLLAAAILRSYGIGRLGVLLGAGLLCVHPIVVEPVVWITGAKDLLAALFVLLGFWIYRRGRERPELRRRLAVGLLLCEALGLLAKPIAVVLPALVLADLLIDRPRAFRPLLGAALAAGALAGIGTVVSYRSQLGVGAVHAGRSPGGRLLYVGQHLALQLKNYFLPTELLPSYLEHLEPRRLLSPWGVAGGAVLLALALLLLAAWKRGSKRLLFALLWMIICFAPSSGLVPLNRGPADSYFYLPGLGLGLAAGLAAEALRGLRFSLAWPVGALLLMLSLTSFFQTELWRSSVSVWHSVYEATPDNLGSYRLYANSLINAGRVREAIGIYEKALGAAPYPPPPPEGPTLLLTMGDGCLKARDLPCALHWYGEAVRHYPLDLRQSLRLAGLARAAPIGDKAPAYAAEIAAARRQVAAALGQLLALPPPQREVGLRVFFETHLRKDRNLRPALGAYLADPVLGPAARALLELWTVR